MAMLEGGRMPMLEEGRSTKSGMWPSEGWVYARVSWLLEPNRRLKLEMGLGESSTIECSKSLNLKSLEIDLSEMHKGSGEAPQLHKPFSALSGVAWQGAQLSRGRGHRPMEAVEGPPALIICPIQIVSLRDPFIEGYGAQELVHRRSTRIGAPSPSSAATAMARRGCRPAAFTDGSDAKIEARQRNGDGEAITDPTRPHDDGDASYPFACQARPPSPRSSSMADPAPTIVKTQFFQATPTTSISVPMPTVATPRLFNLVIIRPLIVAPGDLDGRMEHQGRRRWLQQATDDDCRRARRTADIGRGGRRTPGKADGVQFKPGSRRLIEVGHPDHVDQGHAPTYITGHPINPLPWQATSGSLISDPIAACGGIIIGSIPIEDGCHGPAMAAPPFQPTTIHDAASGNHAHGLLTSIEDGWQCR
ncbi:hypothetical protein ACLOJK_037045 [Asimina triloba]